MAGALRFAPNSEFNRKVVVALAPKPIADGLMSERLQIRGLGKARFDPLEVLPPSRVMAALDAVAQSRLRSSFVRRETD